MATQATRTTIGARRGPTPRLLFCHHLWRCAWHGCASFHALCWAKYLGGLCFAAAGQDWREAVADDLSDHHATLSTKLTELPVPLQNRQPWRELVKAHPKPWKQILVAEQESLQQMGLRMDSSNGENQDLDEQQHQCHICYVVKTFRRAQCAAGGCIVKGHQLGGM